MLVLKTLAFFRDEPQGNNTKPSVSHHATFGRAITRAREGYIAPDPDITGAVGKKDEPSDGKLTNTKHEDAKGNDGKAVVPTEGDKKILQMAQATKPGNPIDLGGSRASPSERALLERLTDRREQIDNRSREVDTREALLKAAEKKLDSRVNDLKSMEDRLQATLDNREQSQATVLKNLVTMYETMKPKEAARVFDRLDMKVLIPVVQKMNPRKMAEILAAMQPEAAEKLTIALATRQDGAAEPQGGQPLNELPRLDGPAAVAPAADAARQPAPRS
ncbi:MAG: MotE family protein [Beijerinckiaceae bacterium]